MKLQRGAAGLMTGVIFGLGLATSQMTNPEKVLAFLTLLPGWDPSLLLVMGAAVLTTFAGYRWTLQRAPLFAPEHSLPTNRLIDSKLLWGAVIFGFGWGLAGYCPGPAIAGLASGSTEPLVFLAFMIGGSQLTRRVLR